MSIHINLLPRRSIKERLWKTLNIFVGVTTLLNVSMLGALANPATATAATTGGSGAVWTTTSPCDAVQDANHYSVGAPVYLHFSNFALNTDYSWAIVGQPGGSSSKPNMTVASGTYGSGPSGQGCFFAYTVASDDRGEFKYSFGEKSDNYRVDGSTTGTIELKKVWSGTAGQTTLKIGSTLGAHDVASQLTGVNGTNPLTTGAKTVVTGTYYLSEVGGLTNYSAGPFTCTKHVHPNNIPVTVGTDNSVAVGDGQVITCSITNTYNPPPTKGTIELKKIWSGTPNWTTLTIGTSYGGDYIKTINTGANGAAPQSTGSVSVDPGTYYLGEHDGLGLYTRGPLVCKYASGAPVTVGQYDSITVAAGDSIVCSITNTYSNSYIVVKKLVDPSSDPTKFNFTGDITTTIGNTQSVSRHVVPGKYTVTEDALPTGWSLSSINCDKAGGTGDIASRTATYNVGVNETITCTFTNKLTPPDTGKITGYKKDSDGNKLNGWEICLKKHSDGWDKKTCVTTGSGSWATGYYEFTGLSHADYDLRETMQTNWHAVTPSSGSWAVHVNTGSTVAKDFVNAPDVGYLKVYKDTDPYSGSATFSITASGTSPITTPTRSIKDGSPVTYAVTPGTYSVTEDLPLPAGWYLESNTCVNKVVSKDQTTSCTITNHKAITIQATKLVCNSESDLPDWGIVDKWGNDTGPNITATSATDWINGNVAKKISAHPGCHLATDWNFQYHISPATKPANNTGEVAGWTTFGPTNASGIATATITDFTGSPSIWGREVWKSGYIEFAGTTDTQVKQTSAEFYCATDVRNYDNYDEIRGADAGSTYYCVGFNVAKTATITLTKSIDKTYGGSAGVNDFDLKVGSTIKDSGSTWTVDAGQAYAINEKDLTGTGYEFVSITGDKGCPSVLGGEVTLQPGDDLHCTINNKSIAPKITVVKHVVGEGPYTAGDFVLYFPTGDLLSTNYFAGVEAPGTDVTLKAGAYSVDEFNLPGYTKTLSADCQGTIAVGEAKTCTVTNTYAPVTVLKQVDKPTAAPGEILTYTVTVTNPGDLDVYNAKVTDVIPDHMTPVLPITDGSYDAGTKTITWEGFMVPAGGTKVFTFQATVDPIMPSGSTNVDNTATLGCRILDDVAASLTTNVSTRPVICWSGSSTVRTTITASPTILVTKTGAATAVAGTNVTYTIEWKVNGNAPVTNAMITDAIPANTTYSSATCGTTTGTCIMNFDGTTASWALGSRTPAASGTVTLVLTLASPLANGTVITNTAVFKTTENPEVTSQAKTTVQSAPVLTITKTNNIVSFTNPGQQVTYTVTVGNTSTSTDTAHNVILTDTLPNGFTFVDTGLATKTTAVGDLAPGASKTYTFLVNISAFQPVGTYTNTATAQGDNATLVTATSDVAVRTPQVLGATSEPSLSITKTVSPGTTTPDTIVTYTVTVTNNGDADATNVTIADRLPQGLTFVDNGTRSHTFVLGTIEPSHTRVIHYDVHVGKTVKAGAYKNLAILTADDIDQQQAVATLTVRVPKVLGLATTGPSARDYAIFIIGLTLATAGLLVGRRRRQEGALA